MTDKGNHPIMGRWRIVDADLWDRDFLDLVDPASITFASNGDSKFNFGAVNGSMQCSYSPTMAFFTWTGFDEMDQTLGDGDAEILEDNTLEIQIRFHAGDQATLIARK